MVEEVLAQMDAIIEEVAELAASTNNDAVQLGAIRTRSAVIAEKVEMLQSLGRIPLFRRLGLAHESRGLTGCPTTSRLFMGSSTPTSTEWARIRRECPGFSGAQARSGAWFHSPRNKI